MVIELKYHQGLWIAEDIARVILTTPGYPEYLEGAVLVPVPLHAKRLRRRGYNQSRLIVEHLARLMPGRGVRVADILARTRDTPTQTRLNREARARNAAGAFAVKRGATPDAGARHVVFDDVFTTGATLNACCRALFGAGATNLDVASFAHG
jgi:ComF family protein